MQKPSVIDPPSARVPEKASRWDVTRTETCGGGKSVLGGSLLVSRFQRIYIGRIRSNRAKVGPQGTRQCPGGLSPPPSPSVFLPELLGSLMFRKKSSKNFMAFELHLVLISRKTKNKQKTTLGTKLIGQSQKMIYSDI